MDGLFMAYQRRQFFLAGLQSYEVGRMLFGGHRPGGGFDRAVTTGEAEGIGEPVKVSPKTEVISSEKMGDLLAQAGLMDIL
ncbi:MAG: hypothetical protein AAF485_32535 [Chloroflexota bacterium]